MAKVAEFDSNGITFVLQNTYFCTKGIHYNIIQGFSIKKANVQLK